MKASVMRVCFAAAVTIVSQVQPSALRAQEARQAIMENAENKTTVSYLVNPDALQKFLPAPWKIVTISYGPWKGSNVAIEFRDRIMNLDGKKGGIPGGVERGIIVTVQCRNSETGETAYRVIREYTANSAFVPGAHHNSKLLTDMRIERTVSAQGTGPGTASETWVATDTGGGTATLKLSYQRGIPQRMNGELKMYGSSDPNYHLYYRRDQGVDVAKDVNLGIDRTTSFQQSIKLADFASVFDGTEKLVNVVVMPWYVRETFAPVDQSTSE
jgi:hypothetical protein